MVVAQPDFRTMVLTSLHNNIRQVFTAASLPYTIDFLSMVLVHPPLHDWVLKQKGEWLASWLIEYEDFNVRKKTATLIYNLVPCSVSFILNSMLFVSQRFCYVNSIILLLNRIRLKCNNCNKPRKGLSQPSKSTLP